MIYAIGENNYNLPITINIFNAKNYCVGYYDTDLCNLIKNNIFPDSLHDAEDNIYLQDTDVCCILNDAKYFTISSKNKYINELIETKAININCLEIHFIYSMKGYINKTIYNEEEYNKNIKE
jgi:hypothetical protein